MLRSKDRSSSGSHHAMGPVVRSRSQDARPGFFAYRAVAAGMRYMAPGEAQFSASRDHTAVRGLKRRATALGLRVVELWLLYARISGLAGLAGASTRGRPAT